MYVIIEENLNLGCENTSKMLQKLVLCKDFHSLYAPSGCLLNAVCCCAEYLHSPTHLHWITKNLCLLTQTTLPAKGPRGTNQS